MNGSPELIFLLKISLFLSVHHIKKLGSNRPLSVPHFQAPTIFRMWGIQKLVHSFQTRISYKIPIIVTSISIDDSWASVNTGRNDETDLRN